MNSSSTTSAPEVTLDQVDAAARDGHQVIDVREAGEYLGGHVPGARLVPMGQLPARLEELDRASSVYVVCASGGRSAAMTHFLRSAGYDAFSVAGGTSAWQASGRSVVVGAHER